MLHAVGSDGMTFTPSHVCASPAGGVTLHDETECPVFSRDPTMFVDRMAHLYAVAGVATPVNGDA